MDKKEEKKKASKTIGDKSAYQPSPTATSPTPTVDKKVSNQRKTKTIDDNQISPTPAATSPSPSPTVDKKGSKRKTKTTDDNQSPPPPAATSPSPSPTVDKKASKRKSKTIDDKSAYQPAVPPAPPSPLPTMDKKVSGKRTKESKAVEDKPAPLTASPSPTVDKRISNERTKEGKTIEDKPPPPTSPTPTVDKNISIKRSKTSNTIDDKSAYQPPPPLLPVASSSAEPLFRSKETLSRESLSKENLSTADCEEGNKTTVDAATLEMDAIDPDAVAGTSRLGMMGPSEILDAPEYSAKDESAKKEAKGAGVRVKLRRVIKSIMKAKYGGNHYAFGYNDIVKTIKMVKSVLEKEPVVAQCKAPVVIVGDLHGQYTDLLRIFASFDKDGIPGCFQCRYVFLGDYVDRGKQSVEVIMLLFWLKIIHPKQYMMLRGNHEFRAINKTYGFYSELKARFKPIQAEMLYEFFNDAFMHLPVVCIVAGNILCMHGGISSKMKSRDDLFKIKKPTRDAKEDPIACDLLWADPMINLQGEMKNSVRGVSVYFGEDQLDETLKNLGCKLVVRGHQMMMNGFNFFNGHRLVTVFSASTYYPDKPNKGAVMTVSKDGRVGFRSFAALPKEHAANKGLLFAQSHDVMNEVEDGGHAVFNAEKEKEKKEGKEKEKKGEKKK